MRFADQPSWRFAESDAQLLHLAIYIRDAAGLVIPDDPTLPPPLSGPIPITPVGDEADRRRAGAEWCAWWQELLADEADAQQRPPDSGMRDWARSRADARQALFDPPAFTALADRPALRAAAEATVGAALDWSRAQRTGAVGPDGPRLAFPWTTTRDVAEQVARDHCVPMDAVDASAVVLEVDGLWWQVITLGVVAVSRAACADDFTVRTVLRTAFVSALAA